MPADEHAVYLTFDDGPHKIVTPWVLNELNNYNALATFFCIGKNVQQHPDLYDQLLRANHSVGNHTFNHLNGWKTKKREYLSDISKASGLIHSNLFRPPYGKIRGSQSVQIAQTLQTSNPKIIMWDVLSADFDHSLSGEQCLNNVIKNVTNGSIIVFHDSEKAFPHLRYVLPKTLKYLSEEGYLFRKIEQEI